MKQKEILLLALCTSLMSAAWAQAPTTQANAPANRPVYYDTFKEKWLDPTKWQVRYLDCWGTLECVRAIEHNQLRLAVRDFGARDSDSGVQWSSSSVYFVRPTMISSITTDVTLRSFSGIGCSTNQTDLTHTQVMIGGTFFNRGSGNPEDDVSAFLILWVDTRNPTLISVANWSTLKEWTDVAQYPVGTPLTATFAWDQANHQFVAMVEVQGEPSSRTQVAVPYSENDTVPPTNLDKHLDAEAHSLNCSSAQTFAQVEALYKNVRINVPPPPAP